ncbi:type III secretion system (T3SS) inner membrane Yop/YscD-like protein [Salana multivorans]|uniref:Type III secretion system (T3SS) inner membrane Yop/YscD-like protein n=1 Tax=Salana multivorans TaxID=120377 RepID=A0A3N2DAN2_9MICO|nr:DUF3662 and FHA domain-containing protein [Salana multivorans]MBN8883074.1 DUF3662 domain-containing protein [Salana multivorans]OJX96882.1 MAG: hypothetical protein BGO96_02010 [Micrococcales bacterium 73-15]ROR96698.1 type III secretion system (T3SS) inner membrane Yop/YscD-like protein [Salana multivorans]
MGVIDRFEKSVERVVNSAFAKAFRSEVKPVEIAAAIQKEMDERAAAFRGRTVVPNTFEVELGDGDHERVVEWGEDALADEIAAAAADHAREQGYSLVGPISVSFADQPDLETGRFRVHSSTIRDEGYAAAVSAGQAASGGAAVPEPPRHPVIDIDGKRYLLTATSTVLGRGSEADIVVDDTGVSRRHLELSRTPHGVVVTDLGSTNGTFVEGNRITAATLVDGNTVTLGRTRLLFYTGESDAG